MASRDTLGTNLARGIQQLGKLQMVIAERTGYGSAPTQILLDKWLHHVMLKPVLLIHDVVGDAKMLGNAARVVDVVERAAAALAGLGHSGPAGKATLVP